MARYAPFNGARASPCSHRCADLRGSPASSAASVLIDGYRPQCDLHVHDARHLPRQGTEYRFGFIQLAGAVQVLGQFETRLGKIALEMHGVAQRCFGFLHMAKPCQDAAKIQRRGGIPGRALPRGHRLHQSGMNGFGHYMLCTQN
jgi:hypothetical protein